MTMFGFTVECEQGKGWRVYLPHQCDDWKIAGDYTEALPLNEAVAELERFIGEAHRALAALRRGEQFATDAE